MSPQRLAPYVVTGAEEVAEAYQNLAVDETVPFPWDLPPKNSSHIYQPGKIAAPADATQAIVCSYQVPAGFQFVLRARLHIGNMAIVEMSGDVTWRTDVNTPLTTVAAQGVPIQGLEAETFSVGSLANGPVEWWGRTVYRANDIIRVKVTTANGAIAPGAPNYFLAILCGWIWPLDKKDR